MLIWISIILSYVIVGCANVFQDFGSRPESAPIWTYSPTAKKMFLAGVLWPYADVLNSVSSSESRRIAFAILACLEKWSKAAFLIWGCASLSELLFNNSALVILTAIVLVYFSFRYLMPLLSLLSFPIVLIISWPLDLIFPEKKRVNVKAILWCKNCTNFLQKPLYTKKLWQSELQPELDQLPCKIAQRALPVWRNYYARPKTSRSLFPDECPHFDPNNPAACLALDRRSS